MGYKRWRLNNDDNKITGQLDRVKHFLANATSIDVADDGTNNLSACSVSIPIQMDQKNAILAAGDLASNNTRSFEIWWDGAEKRAECVLIADKMDLIQYKQGFLNMYPNVTFSAMKNITPEWFEPQADYYRIFDVGTKHGHYSAIFDKNKAHNLISKMINTLQPSKNAWVQIVFKRHPFDKLLRLHLNYLNSKILEIRGGNYLSTAEIIGLSNNKKPHAHPEVGYDFDNNYSGLQRISTLKMQSEHVMMSIRGIIQSEYEIDLNFDGIDSIPTENISSGYEHLDKFRYKYQNFYNAKKPKKVQVQINDSKKRISRIDIFEHRLLPDPDKFCNKALKLYFNKKWLRGYQDRNPMPYLILNLSEMSPFVCLPDSTTTQNVRITRGVSIPSKPSEKEGVRLGSFERKVEEEM